MNNELFFKFLRFATRQSCEFDGSLSAEEWARLYKMASKQTLLGIFYAAILRLPSENHPPAEVTRRWSYTVESIKGMNLLMNSEAARLTRLFVAEGRQPVILKGQANARLYPDPSLRQPGDIDIWVDGGRSEVVALLKKLGMMEGASVSQHHVHLPGNERGVSVEVHFKASSGSRNPFVNRRLQAYLNAQIRQASLVPEGFYVPSMKFALVMQLSHIYQHFLGYGIGFRQLMDYNVLLQNSSDEERRFVAARLAELGLCRIAGAVMWVQKMVFGLKDSLLLCEPDEYRGKWLLRIVMEGGNFGNYDARFKRFVWMRWLLDRKRSLNFLPFDPSEVIWCEIKYWIETFRLMPKRIRVGKLGLGGR